MKDVTLPPELECFAAEAIATGRYRNVTEIVTAALSLLRRLEAERTTFIESLELAESDADRNGWHTLDQVQAEADRIIAAKRDAA